MVRQLQYHAVRVLNKVNLSTTQEWSPQISCNLTSNAFPVKIQVIFDNKMCIAEQGHTINHHK